MNTQSEAERIAEGGHWNKSINTFMFCCAIVIASVNIRSGLSNLSYVKQTKEDDLKMIQKSLDKLRQDRNQIDFEDVFEKLQQLVDE